MSEVIQVKVSTLKLVYDSLIPIRHRVSAILEDIFAKSITVSDPHRALLLEFGAHAYTLKILFEDYFEIAANSEKIDIPKQEYVLLINMAKSVESAARADFGNISLWEH